MTKVILLAVVLAAAARNHAGLDRPASEADLLRAFGYASCLAEAYKNTAFGRDAERVADLYRQMGKVPIEPYDDIRRLAASLNPAKPAIVDGSNYGIMACLEFYESARLKRLSRSGAAKK